MTQPPEQWEDLRGRIHAQAAAARRRTADLRDLAAQVRQVTGEASTRDRSVVVTADTSGAVTELTLRETAMDWSTQELASTLLQLIRQAQRTASESAAELTRNVLGADHPVASDMTEASRRLAEPDRG